MNRQRYTLGDRDVGKKITFTVTGKMAGRPKTSATSEPSGPVDRVHTGHQEFPSYSWTGLPAVGDSLRVTSPGKWDRGAKISYQWMRSGKPIKGATGSGYRVRSADKGKQLSVKVTGKAPNLSPTTLESLPVPVIASREPGSILGYF